MTDILAWLTGPFGSIVVYIIMLVLGFAWIMRRPDGEIERSPINRIKKFCRSLSAK